MQCIRFSTRRWPDARKRMSKENELRKKRIASLTNQIENCIIEFHKYEQEKKHYDE